MKRTTLYGVAAVLAVAALFFFMTTARAKVQCRVCMEFRGRTNCAAAVGPTEQAARDGARPPPRRSGDSAGAPQPARRLLRVPARGEPRGAAHLEGADGLALDRSPGTHRRPGPALGGADAGRRAGPDGRLQDRGLGERRAPRAPRAPARLSQRLP